MTETGNTLEARFWAKVEKTGDCWLWKGAKSGYGHGRMWSGDRLVYAHRLAWQFAHGEIPEGQMVLHRCDVPACVRIDHLFLGDASANQRDASSKGRLAVQRRPKQYEAYLAPHRGPGAKNGNAKLTDALAQEIRERYANGEGSTRKLGAEYGLHSTTILRVVNGERWAKT